MARLPWVLQVLGAIAIVAGAATVFIGVDRARAIALDIASGSGRRAVVRFITCGPWRIDRLCLWAGAPRCLTSA